MLNIKRTAIMNNFIQNNLNIELNDKVVFTVAQLEAYVTRSRMNVEMVSANGCAQFDPEIVESEEVMPVSDYVDEHFDEVCGLYYSEVVKRSDYPFGHKQGFVK